MMIFNRTANRYLKAWRLSARRKPLIIRGARQVGKTTLIKKFSESFKQKILLNLEVAGDLSFFQKYDDVKTLIEALFLTKGMSPKLMSNTILFIDEIQESPKAIKMLRYFYEEYPEMYVIAAGSLLEFAMKKVKGFPVGRVEYLYLHPLNFHEYLEAIAHESALEQFNRIPIENFAHYALLNLFNRYAIVGGMPEVISTSVEDESILALPQIYESIWGSYQSDVEKYASNETERKVIKYLLEVAPFDLDQRNKFQNFGRSNYRSREVGEAMRNLEEAKIVRIIYPTTDVSIPALPNLRKSPRLQFLDTGLINHAIGIQAELIGMEDLSASYKGALIPHLVTQELVSLNTINDKNPNFWVREKKQASSKVDLVFTYRDKIIPIEIKSGATGTLRSLHQFVDLVIHPYAVRMYAGELKIEKLRTPRGKSYLLMNLPYYLGTKIPEYIAWFVDNN